VVHTGGAHASFPWRTPTLKATLSRALLAGGAIAALLFGSAAHAQLAVPGTPSNLDTFGYSETLLATSVSTPTPVSILSVTGTPHYDPNGYSHAGYYGGSSVGTPGSGNNYPLEHLEVYWSVDMTKATAGLGSCEVFVNGAVYAPSKRSASFSGAENTIASVLDIALTVTGPQTVSLQCFSSDTNALTINAASMYIRERYR
jgi:hypothetical protein